MVKRFLLVSAALLVLSAGANAADRSMAAVPVAAGFDWTGFYLGGTLGIQSQRATRGSAGLFVPGTAQNWRQGLDATGVPVGLVLGYNRQFGRLVLGFEADVSVALGGIRASTDTLPLASVANGPVATPAGRFAIYSRTSWQATLGPRLGILAHDRGLLYVKGGLAAADIRRGVNYNVASAFLGTPLPAGTAFSAESTTRLGWFVGVGAEYALASNWSVKVEYTYANYGSWTAPQQLNPLLAGAVVPPVTTTLANHSVKVGVNYLFSTSTPTAVTARY